jgi:hypothetical protein
VSVGIQCAGAIASGRGVGIGRETSILSYGLWFLIMNQGYGRIEDK